MENLKYLESLFEAWYGEDPPYTDIGDILEIIKFEERTYPYRIILTYRNIRTSEIHKWEGLSMQYERSFRGASVVQLAKTRIKNEV